MLHKFDKQRHLNLWPHVKTSLKQRMTFQLILTLFFSFFSFIDRRLPEYKQRIAGKSIPFEKFSIHKANKYLTQNHRLFLPGMVSDH